MSLILLPSSQASGQLMLLYRMNSIAELSGKHGVPRVHIALA
ncbi:MAG TPA: hypothetical protein VFU22_25705 [Roseiflexaceae bacterium]|nr:hypothetical protein [Roseiflexaceae bacterium]